MKRLIYEDYRRSVEYFVSKGTIASGMSINSLCYERGNLQLGTSQILSYRSVRCVKLIHKFLSIIENLDL